MPSLAKYWRTLSYCKPSQVYWRLWFKAFKPPIDLSTAPRLRGFGNYSYAMPARRKSSLTPPTFFRFLNELHDLNLVGWDDPKISKLWRYNLHYFDDLNAESAATRSDHHRALIHRWIRENPPGLGTGWDPYPTALRIVNWIKWHLAGNPLSSDCIQSLAVQTRWLSKRIEYHLLGNHLFSNAKALVFAGMLFDSEEGNSWLQKGFDILSKEISEQILPDGGQFERSTMYQNLALEDILDLINVTAYSDDASARWGAIICALHGKVEPMKRWSSAMRHPDGEISFFNDSAFGIAPPIGELERYARELGFAEDPNLQPVVHLEPSGYIRLARHAAVALVDVAPIGPDYLPGHAHADSLSFEFSLFGNRLLVNSGTSSYEEGCARSRQRGTAAHNTVSINGADSSEMWAAFRVGRRARPYNLSIESGKGLRIACSHDGYRHLPGKPVHKREWTLTETSLRVVDCIQGEFRTAQARFHLHPLVQVEKPARGMPTDQLTLILKGENKLRVSVKNATLRIEPSTWHPEFGSSVGNTCLALDFAERSVQTLFEW